MFIYMSCTKGYWKHKAGNNKRRCCWEYCVRTYIKNFTISHCYHGAMTYLQPWTKYCRQKSTKLVTQVFLWNVLQLMFYNFVAQLINSKHFWDFFEISQFSKILSLQSFGNLLRNLYIPLLMIIILLPFTSGERKLC